jgi:hypothetical protein
MCNPHLYSLPSIFRVGKSRTLQWGGHVILDRKIREHTGFFYGKPLEMQKFGNEVDYGGYYELEQTSTGWCPMVVFGISSVDSSGYIIRELISELESKS